MSESVNTQNNTSAFGYGLSTAAGAGAGYGVYHLSGQREKAKNAKTIFDAGEDSFIRNAGDKAVQEANLKRPNFVDPHSQYLDDFQERRTNTKNSRTPQRNSRTRKFAEPRRTNARTSYQSRYQTAVQEYNNRIKKIRTNAESTAKKAFEGIKAELKGARTKGALMVTGAALAFAGIYRLFNGGNKKNYE